MFYNLGVQQVINVSLCDCFEQRFNFKLNITKKLLK